MEVLQSCGTVTLQNKTKHGARHLGTFKKLQKKKKKKKKKKKHTLGPDTTGRYPFGGQKYISIVKK